MFEGFCSQISSMAGWMECFYGSWPFLHLGRHNILSCCGVQQGFALAVHPVIERIKREVPDLLINVLYLDYDTLCGWSGDLLKGLNIIDEEGPSRGLFLNRNKSLLFVLEDDIFSQNPLPSVIPITRDGFVFLGSPVGSQSFCFSYISSGVRKTLDIIPLLSKLKDSQMECVLLRSCLSIHKFSFSLRTCPPRYTKEVISSSDISCTRLCQTWVMLPCLTGLEGRLLCQSHFVVLVFVKHFFMPQGFLSALGFNQLVL